MNYLKTNTSGIDCVIKDIQQSSYDMFVSEWGDINMYGRAYRNPDDKKKIIPELFDGKRYQDIYPDSKERGIIFFIDGTKDENLDDGLFKSRAKVVFMLNIGIIYETDRRDDKAHQIAFQILEDSAFNFVITGLEKTIDEVFRGFDTKKIPFENMHPYHIFAITGDLTYELLNNC